MITAAQLNHWFTFHSPAESAAALGITEAELLSRYGEIRAAAKEFAATILRLTPSGADQASAIGEVREAVLWANSALANGGV